MLLKSKKNKIAYAAILFLLILINPILSAQSAPTNVRINNTIRAAITDLNPVITWNSADTYLYYHIQISSSANFSSALIDSALQSANNFFLFTVNRSDTYYIRIKTSQNNIVYSSWSDTDATDYFILNLSFNSINIINDTISYTRSPLINWTYNTVYSGQTQNAYILYWRKAGSMNWTDSGGQISSSANSGQLLFSDSGIYQIRLALIDGFGNISYSVSAQNINYDTSDINPPTIDFYHYPKLIKAADTEFNITALLTDKALYSATVQIYNDSLIVNSFFPLQPSGIFTATIPLFNLNSLDKIYLKIIFSDEAANTSSITDTIIILAELLDFQPPVITINPDIRDMIITDTQITLRIVAVDSSAISDLKIEYNNNILAETTAGVAMINFNQQDSGLIKLKINAADIFNNTVERYIYFTKNNSGVINQYIQPPALFYSSISDLLKNQAGALINMPDSIQFYFNNPLSGNSVIIRLISGDSSIIIPAVNLTDTILQWNNIQNINTSEEYYFKISGSDSYGGIFNSSEKQLQFKLYSNPSKRNIITKNNFIIDCPANAVTDEPFWIEIKNIEITDPLINAAVDSSITIIPQSARRLALINVAYSDGRIINSFNQPVLIGINYKDSNNDNLIDGAANLTVDKLTLLKFDEATAAFKKTAEQNIDKINKIIFTRAQNFSVWALGYNEFSGSIAESLIIFPSGRYADMNVINKIYFRFQPLGGVYTFKIFSKNGALVRTFSRVLSADVLYTDIEYDLTDNNGKRIAAGSYFLMIESAVSGRTLKPFIVVD